MLFIAEIFKNLLVVKIQTIFISRIEMWSYADLLSLSWNYDFFSWKKKLVPLSGIDVETHLKNQFIFFTSSLVGYIYVQ